jgi:hypothetical protein
MRVAGGRAAESQGCRGGKEGCLRLVALHTHRDWCCVFAGILIDMLI